MRGSLSGWHALVSSTFHTEAAINMTIASLTSGAAPSKNGHTGRTLLTSENDFRILGKEKRMAVAAFDTLKYVKQLKQAGVLDEQAEPQTTALAEILQAGLQDFAKKSDLGNLENRLDAKIADLENRLDAKIADLDNRLNAKMSDLDNRLNGKVDKLSADLDHRETRLDGKNRQSGIGSQRPNRFAPWRIRDDEMDDRHCSSGGRRVSSAHFRLALRRAIFISNGNAQTLAELKSASDQNRSVHRVTRETRHDQRPTSGALASPNRSSLTPIRFASDK
jgi:hypothetical protein